MYFCYTRCCHKPFKALKWYISLIQAEHLAAKAHLQNCCCSQHIWAGFPAAHKGVIKEYLLVLWVKMWFTYLPADITRLSDISATLSGPIRIRDLIDWSQKKNIKIRKEMAWVYSNLPADYGLSLNSSWGTGWISEQEQETRAFWISN